MPAIRTAQEPWKTAEHNTHLISLLVALLQDLQSFSGDSVETLYHPPPCCILFSVSINVSSIYASARAGVIPDLDCSMIDKNFPIKNVKNKRGLATVWETEMGGGIQDNGLKMDLRSSPTQWSGGFGGLGDEKKGAQWEEEML